MSKTIKVEGLKNMMNRLFSVGYASSEYRAGQIDVLEAILHETKNYKGFRYLRPSEVPAGELPGIALECVDNASLNERFPVGKTDKTRVHYF